MKDILFFELIRIAIGRQESFSHTPTDEEWRELFAEAKRQTLVGVLYEGLSHISARDTCVRGVPVTYIFFSCFIELKSKTRAFEKRVQIPART